MSVINTRIGCCPDVVMYSMLITTKERSNHCLTDNLVAWENSRPLLLAQVAFHGRKLHTDDVSVNLMIFE